MSSRIVLAVLLAIVALGLAVLLVEYVGGVADETQTTIVPDNRYGPAEGGALETGAALQTEGPGDIQHLPPMNVPPTIDQYPPTQVAPPLPPERR